jgi:cytochrome c peroxidase
VGTKESSAGQGREVARTAPYMHDGSLATLDDVIELYDGGGRANPNLDREVRPLQLTDAEKQQLKALLLSLSGQVTEGLQTP